MARELRAAQTTILRPRIVLQPASVRLGAPPPPPPPLQTAPATAQLAVLGSDRVPGRATAVTELNATDTPMDVSPDAPGAAPVFLVQASAPPAPTAVPVLELQDLAVGLPGRAQALTPLQLAGADTTLEQITDDQHREMVAEALQRVRHALRTAPAEIDDVRELLQAFVSSSDSTPLDSRRSHARNTSFAVCDELRQARGERMRLQRRHDQLARLTAELLSHGLNAPVRAIDLQQLCGLTGSDVLHRVREIVGRR